MKSSIRVVIAALIFAAVAVCSAQRIHVQVNGEAVSFPNAQPQYINGRVLVPLRGVFEQMGASVDWNPQTRMVSANKAGSNVELRIGDRTALVNGGTMNLDVPAMIVNGSTMVPIRFVSEALGAQVGWLEAEHLVTISTTFGQNSTVVTPPRHLRRVVISANEVIPATLDNTLSSVDNQRGDKFTATVQTRGNDTYGSIPEGTKIEGHIAAVHPKSNNKPAILDLAFDRLRFPDGRRVKISGTLTSLDDRYVTENGNGILVARNNNNTDQRMVYAGYGAGAGLLVGVLSKKPLEGAILGGALGYILGQIQHDQRRPSNITLSPGTELGVRVNRDVTVTW